MNSLPEGFDAGSLIGALADGWGFDVATIDYAAVGFGSYHWIATDTAGMRGFVTVDDLDLKPWLGDTRESAFDGLRRAFGSAVALCDTGLRFVLAPILASDGEPLRRVGARHSAALFPFVDGRAAEYGKYDTPEERAAVIELVAGLHQATAAVETIARRIDLDLPGRRSLESGLRDVDEPWSGAPFSEPARQALANHASDVVELLGLFDRLSRDVAARATKWVITHGEPHSANVIRTDGGYVLIDWDTVALAPPERDLWMLLGDSGDDPTAYAETTGHVPDVVAMDFFRLAWDLADLADFLEVLRSPHRDSDDTAKAYAGLTTCVAIRDRWAGMLE